MKRLHTISKNIIAFAVGFWLLETLFFLFLDGWHYEAIRPEEKLLDLNKFLGNKDRVVFVYGLACIIY